MKTDQSRTIMDRREQGSNVTASQQDFRARGKHAVIEFFQQVIAAITAAHADQRRNVITPPELLELMGAPFHGAGKVKIAVKDVLRINRLVSHLAQAVAAGEKTLVVEAAGRSDKPDLVTPAQSGRPNDLCRSGDLASAKKFSLANQLRRTAQKNFAVCPTHYLRASSGMYLYGRLHIACGD